jgi:hypothetical protein
MAIQQKHGWFCLVSDTRAHPSGMKGGAKVVSGTTWKLKEPLPIIYETDQWLGNHRIPGKELRHRKTKTPDSGESQSEVVYLRLSSCGTSAQTIRFLTPHDAHYTRTKLFGSTGSTEFGATGATKKLVFFHSIRNDW